MRVYLGVNVYFLSDCLKSWFSLVNSVRLSERLIDNSVVSLSSLRSVKYSEVSEREDYRETLVELDLFFFPSYFIDDSG